MSVLSQRLKKEYDLVYSGSDVTILDDSISMPSDTRDSYLETTVLKNKCTSEGVNERISAAKLSIICKMLTSTWIVGTIDLFKHRKGDNYILLAYPKGMNVSKMQPFFKVVSASLIAKISLKFV